MERNITQVNDFLKTLNDFRETVNIVDFFFQPYVAHITRLIPKDVSEKHRQRNFEISVLLSGNMSYAIGNREISLSPGDVIIIPPGIKHYWHVSEDPSDIFSFIVNISKHGNHSRKDISLLNESIKNHNYHIEGFSNFEAVVRQIVNEALEQKSACRDKVTYLARIAFIELIRTLLPRNRDSVSQRNFPPARGENTKDIVEIVNYYIQDNISHPITLRKIADYIGLSTGHLNYLYKKETNITVNQAIIKTRMTWACRYLKQTDRQVKDIASMLGYADTNYFFIQFKKRFGITPSGYRHSND